MWDKRKIEVFKKNKIEIFFLKSDKKDFKVLLNLLKKIQKDGLRGKNDT